MGAWIEIISVCSFLGWIRVAPLVGAWIEIKTVQAYLPRQRVAPLVGAWIEIFHCIFQDHVDYRRSPCGSVD